MLNLINKYRGVIVDSMETINQYKTWGCKPRLVGKIRSKSYEGKLCQVQRKGSTRGKTMQRMFTIEKKYIAAVRQKCNDKVLSEKYFEIVSVKVMVQPALTDKRLLDAFEQICCAGDVS
ncbi:hypothetical protein TNCV_704941 [Trichonephila clavipes]|nr:hypothetical protein TNCV_704941 [Trichonephila clavipes]